jgi:hypothetical protein
VDFNTLQAGLGDAERRNPRMEVVDKYPITSNIKFLTSLGFERPLFDNLALETEFDRIVDPQKMVNPYAATAA